MQELRRSPHKKMTPNENSGSRMRTWQEEAEMLLSLLNCFVLEREAVFASSEFFTEKRFYDLCLEHDVRTPEELEKKLGPEYNNRLLTKNKEQGMHFAASCMSGDTKLS
jgi:hypothetical protein